MPTTKRNPRIEPLRLSPRSAAIRLDVHYDTVHELITRGLFTVIAPLGRGQGKRIYVPRDEVDAYALGGEEALKELRYEKQKNRPARRGS
jgi:hypothetical protein